MSTMKRRRGRFSRLGLLPIALLLALCVTGVGYAAWTDEVYIEGTVGMGYIGVVLNPDVCSPPVTCSVSSPHTLHVTFSNPQAGNYTCGFTITSTGTIPVKIQSIDTSDVPNGVAVSVTGVMKGTQIEQAGVYPDSVVGAVTVTVPTSCEEAFSFDIVFSFVHWNLYEE